MKIEEIVDEINRLDEKDYYETVNSDSLKENGEFLQLYKEKISKKIEKKQCLELIFINTVNMNQKNKHLFQLFSKSLLMKQKYGVKNMNL